MILFINTDPLIFIKTKYRYIFNMCCVNPYRKVGLCRPPWDNYDHTQSFSYDDITVIVYMANT